MFIPLLINFSFPWIAGAFPSSGTYDWKSEGWKFDQKFLKTSKRKDFLHSTTAVEFQLESSRGQTLKTLSAICILSEGRGVEASGGACFLPAVIDFLRMLQ